jgi:hypothetical protein
MAWSVGAKVGSWWPSVVLLREKQHLLCLSIVGKAWEGLKMVQEACLWWVLGAK